MRDNTRTSEYIFDIDTDKQEPINHRDNTVAAPKKTRAPESGNRVKIISENISSGDYKQTHQ